MNGYLVLFSTTPDGCTTSTVCETKDDLATLIANLDTDFYLIHKIEKIEGFNPNIKDFCKAEPKLETGENK